MLEYNKLILGGKVGIIDRKRISLDHVKDLLYTLIESTDTTNKIIDSLEHMKATEELQVDNPNSWMSISPIVCLGDWQYNIRIFVNIDGGEKENGRKIKSGVSGQCGSSDQSSQTSCDECTSS